MYITNINIKGLKWIDDISGIKSIDIQAVSQLQIVIGTNGSGKTRLLEQITPLPANKNDYFPDGYKKLTILHDGDEYVVTSIFEKKTGKHSFIKNGSELNVSGLTTLQTELCKEHLGYTQLIDDLTHCRYQFCDMSIADRKQLLLSMSPSVPDFVIQYHKQVKSELRACKNNLNLLYSRKSEVEEKLLDLEILEQLKKESNKLNQQQIDLSNEIYLLQNRIKEYRQERDNLQYTEVTEDKARLYKKRIQSVLHHAPIKIHTTDLNELINKLNIEKSECENKIEHLKDKYHLLQTELNQYDPSILEDKEDESVKYINLLEQKSKRLTEIDSHLKYNKIPEQRLDRHYTVFDQLYQLFVGDGSVNYRQWYPGVMHTRVKSKLATLQSEYNEYTHEKNRLIKEQTELEASLKFLPAGPIDRQDNCTQCDYASHYDNEKNKIRTRLKKINEEYLPVIDKSLKRLSRVIERLSVVMEMLDIQKETLQRVFSLLSGTIWQYTEPEILDIFNGDLNHWLHQLHRELQAQQFISEAEQLKKEIQSDQATIEALNKAKSPAMEILKKLYREKQEQRYTLQREILSLGNRKEDITVKLTYCERYKKLKEAGERLIVDLERYQEYVYLDEYLKYLTESILVSLMEEKQELDKKIYAHTAQLKEQETLRSRYTEEILSLIEKIEKRQNTLTYMEIGLNPESGFPHYNTLKFINAILENVNFVLSKIWTYPIQIELLKEDDDVSCDFQLKRNRQLGPIARASKSQKAAINFAFYIALVYAIDATEYPMFFDECDDGFDKRHKQTFLEWMKVYIESQQSSQLWMIYHDPVLYAGFLYKDIICLKEDNIQLPQVVNMYTKIERA